MSVAMTSFAGASLRAATTTVAKVRAYPHAASAFNLDYNL
jgi:hypothetical protein